MKKKFSYLFGIGGMVLLVCISLVFPQIIFAIQDSLRMEHTEAEERSNLNVFRLDLSYEQNTNARLTHFLSMEEVMVTAIEHEFPEDSALQELLEKVLKQGWFAMPFDKSMMSTYVYTSVFRDSVPLAVQDCKKYLVHGRDYQDGVALMMWYLDLYVESVDMRLRILVDTETDTIYYAKVTDGVNKKMEEDIIDKKQIEQLYYWADSVGYYCEYYASYYESMQEPLYSEKGSVYDIEQSWLVETKTDGKQYCEVTFPLYYGGVSAEFQVRTEAGRGSYPNLTMGISAIGEKIPEMMQD